jgi:branched-chain amino acid transport system substrate-binding protein
VIGVDLGGTNMAIGVVDEKGRILGRCKRKTKALEGRAFITFGGVDPKLLTGKGKDFYESYKKTYGGEPEGYAVYGYEAAKVVIAAMQRIHAAGRGITREAVLAEVGATKDFAGALGTWSFDANGDTTNRTMSVNTVKDGDFTTVKVVN